MVYIVPDSRVQPGFPKVRLKTKFVKKFPVVGQVIGVLWKGKDSGSGIRDRLRQDVSVTSAMVVRSSLLRLPAELEIRAYPDHGCWILTVKDELIPLRQKWDGYKSIANHLLAMPIPPGSLTTTPNREVHFVLNAI